jgi:5-methylcytosine-specific restriction protein B
VHRGWVRAAGLRGVDFSGCTNRADVRKRFEENGKAVSDDDYGVTAVTTFLTRMKLGDLLVVTDGNFKFRAIGEVTGEYKRLGREEQGDDYGQSRKVKWHRVYSPSLPFDQLMNNQFSQMTLYELKSGSIDIAKLSSLLGAAPGPVPSNGDPFVPGHALGNSYKIGKVTAEVIEVEKKGGTAVPITRKLLTDLVALVKSGKIVEDIWGASRQGARLQCRQIHRRWIPEHLAAVGRAPEESGFIAQCFGRFWLWAPRRCHH